MKKWINLLPIVVILVGIIAIRVFLPNWFASNDHQKIKSHNEKVYFGLFIQDVPNNMKLVSQFQDKYQFSPHAIFWFLDWKQPFPYDNCLKIQGYGAVPHIVWEPWDWENRNAITLNDIIQGKHDDYILSWAIDAKKFGHTFYIRFAHEFNIEWYPWAVMHNGKNPEIYIKAFRHVVDIFKNAGATNVLWVWAPLNYSFPLEPWNDYVKAYPGDDYVDWIGIDGYNWGNSRNWSQWVTFEDIFKEPVRILSNKFPSKPIMIAEFGSAESGGDKAKWIQNIPKYLQTTLKPVKSINWFNIKKETDWRIHSSPEAISAFTNIIHSPIFQTAAFSQLSIKTTDIKIRPKKVLMIGHARIPKIIDANLSDWRANHFTSIEQIEQIQVGAPSWQGPSDLSVKVQFNWDALNLYCAFDITDDIPLKNTQKENSIWNGDAIEISMATNPDASSSRTTYYHNDYQIGISGAESPNNWIWTHNRALKNSEIKTSRTPHGYIIEAKIPWTNFGHFRPQIGYKIGFDVAIDDADEKNRETQMVFNGDYLFYKDPSVWGIAKFK